MENLCRKAVGSMSIETRGEGPVAFAGAVRIVVGEPFLNGRFLTSLMVYTAGRVVNTFSVRRSLKHRRCADGKLSLSTKGTPS